MAIPTLIERAGVRRLWPGAVLAVMLAVWIAPVTDLSGGWWWSGSMRYDLQRALGVVDAWRCGLWDARWFPSFDYGYGYPFLSFYAPLFHWLSGLGIVFFSSPTVAVRVNLFLWLVFGAAGMYLAGERAWNYLSDGRAARYRPGLICATGWLMSPYPMCNAFIRGALPEFASSQTLPWIVWAAFGILGRVGGWSRRDSRELLLLVLFVSFAILSHNFTGMCVFGIAVTMVPVFLVLRSLGPDEPRRTRSDTVRYSRWAIAMGWGLLATLFFWLPILYEGRYVHVSKMKNAYSYSYHYLYLSNLVDLTNWEFGASVEGPEDTMPLHLGFVALLASLSTLTAIVVLAATGFRRRRRLAAGVFLLLLATAFAILITTPLTGFLWDRLPLLQYAQFPWRLLNIATLGVCLLLPAGIVALDPSGTRIAAAVIIAVLAVCFGGSHHFYGRIRYVIPYGEDADPRNWDRLAIRTANIDEYGPIWRDKNREPKWPRGALLVDGTMEVSDLEYKGISVRASIKNRSDQSRPLVLAWNYFPGWQGRIEPGSKPLTLSPEPKTGLIRIQHIPPGSSNLHVWFGNTRVRCWCKLVSGLAWLLWLGVWLRWALDTPGRIGRSHGTGPI